MWVKLSTHFSISPGFLRRRTHYPWSKRKTYTEVKTCRRSLWVKRERGEEGDKLSWTAAGLWEGRKYIISGIFFICNAEYSVALISGYLSSSKAEKNRIKKMSRPPLWGINPSLKHSNELICYKKYEIIEIYFLISLPQKGSNVWFLISIHFCQIEGLCTFIG